MIEIEPGAIPRGNLFANERMRIGDNVQVAPELGQDPVHLLLRRAKACAGRVCVAIGLLEEATHRLHNSLWQQVSQVLVRQAQEQRILVTMDKDYGQFIFAENAPHSGLVRLPDVRATRRIELMERLLRDHTRELVEGAILTVRGERIRISRLP